MLIEKFAEIVQRFPGKAAVKEDHREFTYQELNRCADRVAGEILKAAKQPVVGLLLGHSADMIIGILATLKAAKIYVPLDIAYPENRLMYMVEDSESHLILANTGSLLLAQRLAAGVNKEVSVLDIDGLPADPAAGRGANPDPVREPPGEAVAYILYTSGSTGKPRGVFQDHKNVFYYTRNWMQRFSITPADRMTLFSSFSHDGAGQDMFGALLSGAALYPYNIKERIMADELARWLIENKITIWHSVPTVYRYFVNTLDPGFESRKSFPDLRFILLGGEHLREHDIDTCKRFFPGAALANVYGQSESSVSSIWQLNPGDTFDGIKIGEPLDNTEVLIISESGEIIEDVGVGEIFIASEHIARGYWKDPGKTAAAFFHDPGIGRLYRTGDLGRRLPDGSIEFLGRKDTQVKIRGSRVELGEIETFLLKYEGITEAIVVEKGDETGDKFLCAYVVSGEVVTAAELREFLSAELPAYMIPLYFVQVERMPLTPSGKVDRKALPEPSLQPIVPAAAGPRDEVEITLARLWAEVLEIEEQRISLDSGYFELGGHSLKATLLISRIHKELDVLVPLGEFFERPTIRALSSYIKKVAREKYTAIVPAEAKEYYELSPAQKRLYFIHQLDSKSTAYNMFTALLIRGPFQCEKVGPLFQKLGKRHESLRTIFFPVKNKPVQKIIDDMNRLEFAISYFETHEIDTREISREFIRGFDLREAPLMRIGLVKLEQEKHLLMIDIHHLISDGFSAAILTEEFKTFYQGEEPAGLRIQYKDFAEWQNKLVKSPEVKKQENYWLDIFKEKPPLMNLPVDFSSSRQVSFEGDIVLFKLDEDITREVYELTKKNQATVFMVLISVYYILLAKYTGLEDIVVGTKLTGRTHPDLHHMVGMCVNMLALRNRPQKNQTFAEFLEEVKKNALEAFENQDYPFQELVKKVGLWGKYNRNPLFDTVFALLNVDDVEVEVSDLAVTPYAFKRQTSGFDLHLEGTEDREKEMIYMELCYSSGRFKRSTAEKIAERYLEILEQVIDNPGIQLKDISVSHHLLESKAVTLQDSQGYFQF